MLYSLPFRREGVPNNNFLVLIRKPPLNKHTNSRVYKLNWRLLFCCILVGLIFTGEGCSSPVDFSADATKNSEGSLTESRKLSTVFDAGVLFVHESSYVCLPLQKLGIDRSQAIVSIKSTCECVRPSIVRFLERRSQEGVALRLDFVEDIRGHAHEIDPRSLAVEIKLQFASGTDQTVTIQFLHTMQVGVAS